MPRREHGAGACGAGWRAALAGVRAQRASPVAAVHTALLVRTARVVRTVRVDAQLAQGRSQEEAEAWKKECLGT